MIEGLIFITGSIVAFGIVRLKQKWECHDRERIQKANMKLREKMQKVEAENVMLNNPERLIKEFKGGEGSGVGELLKTMQKKVDDITKTTKELQSEKDELQKSVAQFERERNALKNEYDNKLKEAYLGAIDELEGIVSKAMKGGSLDKKKTADKLRKKSEALQDQNESDNSLLPSFKTDE